MNNHSANNELKNEIERLRKSITKLKNENAVIKEKNNDQLIEIHDLKNKLKNEKIIIDSLPVGVVIYNKDGEVSYYNNFFLKLFGYTLDDLPDLNYWFKEVYPDDQYRNEITQKWNNAIINYFNTGNFPKFEAKIKCKDGTFKEIELGFESYEDDIYLTTFFDITERKLAEYAKNISEWRYKIISDLITDYIFVVDIENTGSLKLQWASENLERITGRKQEEVSNLANWMRIIHPDFLKPFKEYIRDVIELNKTGEFECKSITTDCRERWISIFAQKHINKQTGKPSVIGAVKDISLRKNAEITLKEREEKYRNLIENVNEVIYIQDKNGIFTYVSPQAEIIFGYKEDEMIGKAWKEMATEHPVNIKSWGKIIHHYDILSKEPMTNIYEVFHKNGNAIFLEATERIMFDNQGDITGIIGSIRDITKRKNIEDELKKHRNKLEILVYERTEELTITNEELRSVNEELHYANEQLKNQKAELNNTLNKLKETQAQLIQTEKMASLGVLTAGVAHEINNPLNFIQAGIYKLEEIRDIYESQLKNEEINLIFKDAINYIDLGVKRATEIVKSLNRLSRKSTDEKHPCHIHAIVDSCLLILNYEIKYKCTVIKDYYPEDIVIPGFEGKLHQVFLNIITNALQSMVSGTITIQTSLKFNSNEVQILIKDSGKGISPEILDKIFDPFFTTKAPGEGTGLGLSIVYAIIQEHNGKIEFRSEIGKGTEVFINLPLT